MKIEENYIDEPEPLVDSIQSTQESLEDFQKFLKGLLAMIVRTVNTINLISITSSSEGSWEIFNELKGMKYIFQNLKDVLETFKAQALGHTENEAYENLAEQVKQWDMDMEFLAEESSVNPNAVDLSLIKFFPPAVAPFIWRPFGDPGLCWSG